MPVRDGDLDSILLCKLSNMDRMESSSSKSTTIAHSKLVQMKSRKKDIVVIIL